MTPYIILIVEDETDIRQNLAFSLSRDGFKVLEAADGEAALKLAKEKKPDLILMDLMLPNMDGLSVCKMLQKDSSTAEIPVIMLTAKGEEVDRIVGLELGAADYIVKPFSLREVSLRIKGVLKRRVEPVKPVAILHSAEISLDTLSHQVVANGKEVDLTITEFRLLHDLMLHAGQVRSREQLLNSVWNYVFEGYARTVDSHIKRLRAKLGSTGDCIETIRGIGYRLRS